MEYRAEINVMGTWDVVIAGGGPSGICAAVSAARMGRKVLVLERAGVVGGNLTIGHVSPISGGYVKNTMADEINRLLVGDGLPADFEKAKILLTRLLDDEGVEVYLNTSVCDAVREGSKIRALVISTPGGLKAVEGKLFIDATGDGTLSALAGEKVEFGRDDGLVQPVSVMFTISGVAEDQPILCMHEAMDTKLKKGYYLQMCKDACRSGELPPTVDIVRLYQGPCRTDRVVNATQVNGMNPVDPADYTKAQIGLRKQIPWIIDWLKQNVEGFENIRLKDSSDIVGVRESRRVMGQYVLTAEDLVEGRAFEDVIVHKADFPIDIHNPSGAGQAESDALPQTTKLYDIPYRSIVPLVNENLYTAGRCISGTHRAHASYRVMNMAMNLGEAAGIAAALCVQQGRNNRSLDFRDVQKCLRDRQIELW